MSEKDRGYLLVSARTADGVLLVPNTHVRVYDSEGVLLFEGKTNQDGYTSEIEVPTPPLANSLSPNMPKAYGEVSILVDREGYYNASYINVPIFPNVVTVQTANLQPIPGRVTSPPFLDTVIDESGANDL